MYKAKKRVDKGATFSLQSVQYDSKLERRIERYNGLVELTGKPITRYVRQLPTPVQGPQRLAVLWAEGNAYRTSNHDGNPNNHVHCDDMNVLFCVWVAAL